MLNIISMIGISLCDKFVRIVNVEIDAYYMIDYSSEMSETLWLSSNFEKITHTWHVRFLNMIIICKERTSFLRWND